jgi:hypothetical protein
MRRTVLAAHRSGLRCLNKIDAFIAVSHRPVSVTAFAAADSAGRISRPE